MSSKLYTVSRMKDSRGPDGYMYHIYGPAIDEAIKQGKITSNDTWDTDKERLISKIRAKGVSI